MVSNVESEGDKEIEPSHNDKHKDLPWKFVSFERRI